MTTPETLWSALPIAALYVDRDATITDCNPAAEALLNHSAKKLRGAAMTDCFRVEPALTPLLARIDAGGPPLRISAARITIAGREFGGTVHLAPLSAGDQTLVLIQPDDASGFHDVTGAVKSAIGMAEMLAHEIKNPLAGITGAAQLLAMSLDTADAEMTDLIVAESRRILDLLAQVEHFGNLLPPDREAVNLHDVLDRACQSAELGFARGLVIERIYDPSLPLGLADADQLVQVFQNLLKNAAEALVGDQVQSLPGKIEIHTFYDGGMRRRGGDGVPAPLPLQVEIRDNGPGLPPEIAADVFDPFVSGRKNGTGLGLALVSKILSDNGAWITVQSEPGQTVFRVSLPRAPQN